MSNFTKNKFAVKVKLMQDNLQTLRQLAGWTVEKMAARIGVTKQTISNIEHGKSTLSLTQFLAVHLVLDLEIKFRPENEILHKALTLLIDKADIFSSNEYAEIKKAVDTIAAVSYSRTEPAKKEVLANLFENLVIPVSSKVSAVLSELSAVTVPVWLADLAFAKS